MRRAARRDGNEPPIVHGLEMAGWSVRRVDEEDFPDLVLAKYGINLLMEVIGDEKFKKNRTRAGLTEGQHSFHQSWQGTVLTARSLPEALEKAEGALMLLRRV